MRTLHILPLMAGLWINPLQAQGLHAVQPLSGYVCMQLALTPAELKLSLMPAQVPDYKNAIPVHDAPSSTAAVVGYAASTMIVHEPALPVKGFLRVLVFSGDVGWIEASRLRPWSNPYAPSERCVPSLMSNGRPGLGSGR